MDLIYKYLPEYVADITVDYLNAEDLVPLNPSKIQILQYWKRNKKSKLITYIYTGAVAESRLLLRTESATPILFQKALQRENVDILGLLCYRYVEENQIIPTCAGKCNYCYPSYKSPIIINKCMLKHIYYIIGELQYIPESNYYTNVNSMNYSKELIDNIREYIYKLWMKT